MSKPSKLPKFEDWTPPWGDGEFDADKAAKRIYDLLSDKQALQEKAGEKDSTITELQGKVNEFETKDLSEVDRLKRENEQLKNVKPEAGDNLEAARLRIALKKGLSEAQAARLVGSSAEDLEADADAYIEEHGLASSDDKGGGGSGVTKPPTRKPQGNLRTGSESDDDPDDGSDVNPADLIKDLPRSRF